MTRRLNLALLALLLLAGVPCYWLLIDNRPGAVPPRPLAIADLRRLAASLPGPRPVSVALESSASRTEMGNLHAAGMGMKPRRYAALAWQLDVPGGRGIVIDPAMAPADAARIETFDRAARARIDTAARNAGLVLATGDSPDGMRGASASAHAGAAAPGVVVIPTGLPAPGSRMVYVALQDGTEYLFAGDVAPYGISISEIRTRSRLLTDFLRKEDRAESFAWLRAIAALKREAPGLRVIPGHDFDWLHNPDRRHWFRERFPLAAAPAPER